MGSSTPRAAISAGVARSCDLVGLRDLPPQEHSLRPAGTEAAARPKPGPLGLPRLRRLLGCLPASGGAQNLHAHAAALPQRAVRLDGHRSKLLQSTAWYIGSLVFVAALVLPADPWLSLVVREDAGWGICHHADGTGSHVPAHHLLHADGDPASAVALAVARLPHLAAHHECEQAGPIPFSTYVAEAWTYVYQSMTHSLMRKCPDRGRWLGHWGLALGTVMMLTIKVFACGGFKPTTFIPCTTPALAGIPRDGLSSSMAWETFS
jgi:hypothetical protein